MKQVEEVCTQTVLGVAYIRSLRGMVRLMDGGSDRLPGQGIAGWADRSFYVAGVGQL